ncbi:thiamine pyrophosphate-binding protein [Ruicaihuangia caeni]|uniref:thiamine pyrophosphate-binding protein n=1 Tax=Ruicaihuangia caeni TaxID=3042517 RepID=UPI00338F0B18
MERFVGGQVTGGHAVVRALEEHGVTTVFGIPGTHNLEIYRYLAASPIQHVVTRHEQGAAYAADGYFRASGRVAGVVTTSGPGILNAAAAVASAYADGVPIMVITPSAPRGAVRRNIGWMHEVKDQRAAMDAVSEWAETANSAQDAADLIGKAFSDWSCGRARPVVVEVPHDVLLERDVAAEVTPRPSVRMPEPAAADVREFCEAVAEAENPVVVVGGGCVRGHRAVRELCTAIGAPVISTARAKGVLRDDDPLSLGSVFGLASSRELMERADLLVLLGTEVSDAELGAMPLRPSGTVVRVDVDRDQLQKNVRAHLPVLADIAQFAMAATTALSSGSEPVDRSAVIAELRSRASAEAAEISAPFVAVHDALGAALPEDAIITGDSSQVSYMGTALLWPAIEPDQVMYPSGYATLGYGLPAAIGAKLANRDRAVTCLLGDGAFMFSVQELATASDLGLSLPIIVFDNGGFAEIRDEMDAADIPRLAVDIEAPRLSSLADAFGAAFAAPSSRDELADAVKEALTAGRPTVIAVGPGLS